MSTAAITPTATDPAPAASGARVRRATWSSRIGALIGAVIVAWLVMLSLGDAPATQTKVIEICVFVVVASMWNVLAGFTGLVSIGQQAFVGLGAYTLIVFVNGFDGNIYVAIGPAAAVAAIAAVPIGLLAFRLRGAYFAVGMWVISEVVRLLVKQYKGRPIQGGSGTSLQAPTALYPAVERYQNTALIAVALAVAAIVAVYLILRSNLGLALQAVRDSEQGARGLGVAAYRARFTVFIIAALFTGAAGCVWYVLKLRISPDTAFGVADWTAPIIVMVVLGGLGTIEGPIIGAAGWYLLRDYLTDDDSAVHLDDLWYLVLTGGLAVIAALYAQRGVWGTLQQRFASLQLFPLRRTLVVTDADTDGTAVTTQQRSSHE